MKIKICGIFRDVDIDYVNEAGPDYIGFVFAPSRREVSLLKADRLHRRLAEGITAVGVFVNERIESIITLYKNGIISMAQLHGNEDEAYILRLKEKSGGVPVPVIKVIKSEEIERETVTAAADYCLIDSGAGSGQPFNWELLNSFKIEKPWFLAGGINLNNIKQAMALNPFAVDISSGAETNGIKDREKILQLTAMAREES